MTKLLVLSTDLDFFAEQLLCGLHDIGYEVWLALDPRRSSPPKRWSSKLRMASEVQLRGRFDRDASRQYAQLMDSVKPDLCLSFTSRALSVALRARNAANHKTPIVGTRGAIGGVSSWYVQDWFSYLHPQLDCVVCFSGAIRDRLQHEATRLWKNHPGDFQTIYQGYSSLVDTATKRDHVSRANNATKVMMTIANERPIKGLKLLLDALENHVSAKDWQLMLVGQVSDATRRRIEASNQLKDRVVCTGFRADARTLLAQADLYIQPTLSPGEGIGNAIAEAMAAELPVITSDVGGALELVQTIGSELLFKADDPSSLGKTLDLALSDAAHHEEFGRRGSQILLSQFAVQTEVENYNHLFDRLLARSPKNQKKSRSA